MTDSEGVGGLHDERFACAMLTGDFIDDLNGLLSKAQKDRHSAYKNVREHLANPSTTGQLNTREWRDVLDQLFQNITVEIDAFVSKSTQTKSLPRAEKYIRQLTADLADFCLIKHAKLEKSISKPLIYQITEQLKNSPEHVIELILSDYIKILHWITTVRPYREHLNKSSWTSLFSICENLLAGVQTFDDCADSIPSSQTSIKKSSNRIRQRDASHLIQMFCALVSATPDILSMAQQMFDFLRRCFVSTAIDDKVKGPLLIATNVIIYEVGPNDPHSVMKFQASVFRQFLRLFVGEFKQHNRWRYQLLSFFRAFLTMHSAALSQKSLSVNIKDDSLEGQTLNYRECVIELHDVFLQNKLAVHPFLLDMVMYASHQTSFSTFSALPLLSSTVWIEPDEILRVLPHWIFLEVWAAVANQFSVFARYERHVSEAENASDVFVERKRVKYQSVYEEWQAMDREKIVSLLCMLTFLCHHGACQQGGDPLQDLKLIIDIALKSVQKFTGDTEVTKASLICLATCIKAHQFYQLDDLHLDNLIKLTDSAKERAVADAACFFTQSLLGCKTFTHKDAESIAERFGNLAKEKLINPSSESLRLFRALRSVHSSSAQNLGDCTEWLSSIFSLDFFASMRQRTLSPEIFIEIISDGYQFSRDDLSHVEAVVPNEEFLLEWRWNSVKRWVIAVLCGDVHAFDEPSLESTGQISQPNVTMKNNGVVKANELAQRIDNFLATVLSLPDGSNQNRSTWITSITVSASCLISMNIALENNGLTIVKALRLIASEIANIGEDIVTLQGMQFFASCIRLFRFGKYDERRILQTQLTSIIKLYVCNIERLLKKLRREEKHESVDDFEPRKTALSDDWAWFSVGMLAGDLCSANLNDIRNVRLALCSSRDLLTLLSEWDWNLAENSADILARSLIEKLPMDSSLSVVLGYVAVMFDETTTFLSDDIVAFLLSVIVSFLDSYDSNKNPHTARFCLRTLRGLFSHIVGSPKCGQNKKNIENIAMITAYFISKCSVPGDAEFGCQVAIELTKCLGNMLRFDVDCSILLANRSTLPFFEDPHNQPLMTLTRLLTHNEIAVRIAAAIGVASAFEMFHRLDHQAIFADVMGQLTDAHARTHAHFLSHLQFLKTMAIAVPSQRRRALFAIIETFQSNWHVPDSMKIQASRNVFDTVASILNRASALVLLNELLPHLLPLWMLSGNDLLTGFPIELFTIETWAVRTNSSNCPKMRVQAGN
ncbi:hypothetical protein BJ742DRAFT_536788 [Cladochytrium replicatum]|nr:hypothetical protein BJ742DRAFT_536788 [Cladochytrium replicatum]